MMEKSQYEKTIDTKIIYTPRCIGSSKINKIPPHPGSSSVLAAVTRLCWVTVDTLDSASNAAVQLANETIKARYVSSKVINIC